MAVPVSVDGLALGAAHSCVVHDGGKAKCWGRNDEGALGLGDIAPRGVAPGQMGDALPAIELEPPVAALAATSSSTGALVTGGAVKCWGRLTGRGTKPGEVGAAMPAIDLGTGRTAGAIVAGDDHVCALLDEGTLPEDMQKLSPVRIVGAP